MNAITGCWLSHFACTSCLSVRALTNLKAWDLSLIGFYLANTIVMSCLLLAQIENPTVGFFASTSVNFALTYWSISIATTLLLTVLIVCRLLFMRYKLRKVLSAEDRNSPYTSLSSMLIESAFLYAVTALIFIITFAKNDPVQNLVLPVLGQVQV